MEKQAEDATKARSWGFMLVRVRVLGSVSQLLACIDLVVSTNWGPFGVDFRTTRTRALLLGV